MAGKRLLLTVGCNDYPGTGADLRGCVNDALDVELALTGRGYSATRLTDAQATKDAVVGTLTGLVASLRRGDRLVFHYSGHGSNVHDADGDEADGRDEVLVLHDWERGGLLSDDEIHTIMSRKRFGTRVLMLMDSCHSGTLTRFAPVAERGDGVPKFLDVDLLLGNTSRPAPRLRRETSRAIPGVNMISGCDDPEYSYDASFGGRPNGAFTRAALDVLTTERPSTLSRWHKGIRGYLPSVRFPQTPQLASGWQRYTPPL